MMDTATRPLIWEDVPVGRTSGEQFGYTRDLLTTVSVRLEQTPGERETVTHETVTDAPRLSVVSAVWNPRRSDIVASVPGAAPLGHLHRLEPGWETGHILILTELAESHLNDMNAGCDHQTVVWEDGPYGRRPSLDLTERCPLTGYAYGSAWLYRPLPEGTEAALRYVFGGGRA